MKHSPAAALTFHSGHKAAIYGVINQPVAMWWIESNLEARLVLTGCSDTGVLSCN